MLTPQDIREKTFSKAVFGGYDMDAVDDFLEELFDDYSALYKESAVLKSKIKVLVEKVEEYRSTEDAMRMALLTAQKMGDDIIDETKKKSEQMMRDTDDEIAQRRENISLEFADAEARLAAAKEQTEKFVRASEEIMRQHSEFLRKLQSATQITTIEYIRPDEEDEPAEDEQTEEPAEVTEDAGETGDTIREIDKLVAEGEDDDEEEEVEKTRRVMEWSDEDELATPRPKFEFDNLKFGSNFFED